jgi:hypothetical protein
MRDLRHRLQRLEARRLAPIVTALDAELARLVAYYDDDRERTRPAFHAILTPFSEAQIEVLCAAMQVKHTGGYTGVNIRELEAWLTAFRRHMMVASA